MGMPVVHFEVLGKDESGGEALMGFYTGMFDWKIDADNPIGYGSIAREGNQTEDGVGIGGGIMAAPGEMGGHVTFYVEVPDIEAALDKAAELGGERLMGPDQVPGGPIIGTFRDPSGNMVGVIQKGSNPAAY